MLVRIGAILALAGAVLADAPPVPWALPFNNSLGYGPDGPWNFMQVAINGVTTDFFPAIGPGSNLMIKAQACQGAAAARCPSPVPNLLVTQALSNTNLDSSLYDPPLTSNLTQVAGLAYWEIRSDYSLPFPAANIQQMDSTKAMLNLPNRVNPTVGWVPLSLLTLNPAAAHIDDPNVQGKGQTLLGQYLAAASSTAASAIGLTLGSPPFDIRAAGYFSGYDQNRVIEAPEVFVNPKNSQLNLTGLSLGVDTSAGGVSPWANARGMPSNFAAYTASPSSPGAAATGSGLSVAIAPQTPYLSLPDAMCRGIATFLPVSYDANTNLYLWNTSDPAYRAIVTSPSYLNFTFAGGRASSAFSVRVPFALLNLTLDTPVRAKPTPYFPCRGISDKVTGPVPNALGRAFLQAAHLMQSFDPPQIGLAQAPGPKNVPTASKPVAFDRTNPSLAPMPNAPSWMDTWAGVLTPLATPPASPNGADRASTDGSYDGAGSGTANNNTNNGDHSSAASGSSSDPSNNNPALSTGAIAGISAGSAALAGLLFAGLIFCIRRRRQSKRAGGSANGLSRLSGTETPPPGYSGPATELGRVDGKLLYVGPGGQLLRRQPGLGDAYGGGGVKTHFGESYEMVGEGQVGAAEIDSRMMRAEVATDETTQRRAELPQDLGNSWKRFTSEMGARFSRIPKLRGMSVAGAGGGIGGTGAGRRGEVVMVEEEDEKAFVPARPLRTDSGFPAGKSTREFRQVMSDDWERYGPLLDGKK